MDILGRFVCQKHSGKLLLFEESNLAMQILYSQAALKLKKPHFWFTCVVQKRLWLKSLVGRGVLRIVNFDISSGLPRLCKGFYWSFPPLDSIMRNLHKLWKQTKLLLYGPLISTKCNLDLSLRQLVSFHTYVFICR